MAAKTIEGRPTSSRSKREAILASATTYFGKEGYEDSKWADVAKAVGVGSTAL
jgi:AcrR family transcriptional regulator